MARDMYTDEDYTNNIQASDPSRATDVYTEAPSLIGAASGDEPELTVAGVYSDGSKVLPATGVGAGVVGIYNNNGNVKNVAQTPHVAGPAGTWNFVDSGPGSLDTHSPSKGA